MPAELIPELCKSVTFDSLKTRDRDEALRLAAAKRHEIAQELARVRGAQTVPTTPLRRLFLSDDEIRAICERYVATALSADDELRLDGVNEESSDLYADILGAHNSAITVACARGDTSVVQDLLAKV